MPGGQFDLFGKHPCDTYQRLLQINTPSGTCVLDGRGDEVTDLCISGNLEVLGTVTAQEFHTEIISSSIIFESGSTKFGDDCGDLHSFTGSVDISCSLTINGVEFGDFSSSVETRLTDLESFSSSIEDRVTNLEVTVSLHETDIINLQSTVSLHEIEITNLEATQSQLFFTASDHEIRIDALEATRSIAIETGSTNLTATGLESILLGGTGSIDLASDITVTTIIASNLIADSSSISDRVTILEQATGGLWTGSSEGYISRESDVQISGNLDVSGILTAQQLNIELTQSTVLYESGSTKFGDDCGDTHEFTGSVDISCSLAINGVDFGDFSSSVENRLTINEGDILNLQSTQSQLVFTASNHETRIDNAEVTLSQLVITASDHEIRIDNLETTVSLHETEINNLEVTVSLHETEINNLEITASALDQTRVGGRGSGSTGQVAYWRNMDEIEGNSGLLYDSASQVLTISGGFTASANSLINGNLVVEGIVTAQEFHTEFVSSSIIYESGSTKFGDDCGDTHEFTGSVDISCSLAINGVDFGDFSSSVENRVTILENASASFAGDIINLQATASDHEIRITNNETTISFHETEINNLQVTQSQLVFTASNHETRIDNLEITASDHEDRIDSLEETRSIAVETGSNNLTATGLESILLGETGSIDLADNISIITITASNLIADSASVSDRVTELETTVSIHETEINNLEVTVSLHETEINNLRVTASDLVVTASDHEDRIDNLEETRSIAVETGSNNLVGTGLESITLGETGSIDLANDITVTTITASNLIADSSSMSIRVTELENASASFAGDINNLEVTVSIHETEINNLQITASDLVVTASDHEDRIDSLEETRSIAIETGSNNLTTTGLESIILDETGSIDLASDITVTTITASNLIADSASFADDITNLQTTVSIHETRITNNETTVSLHETEINNLEVTVSLHETEINNLQITASNLVVTASDHEIRITNNESTLSLHETEINNLQVTASDLVFTASDHEVRIDKLEVTASDHEDRIDVLEATRSIAIETGSNNLVTTGLESILLGETGSIDLASDITVTTITASNLIADSSSVSTRLTILESVTASEGLWTASDGYISRESNVQITGALCVTGDIKTDGTVDGIDLQVFSSSVENRLNNAESTISIHETEINNLELTASNHETRIANNESTLSTHEIEITALQADSASFSTRVTILEDASASFAADINNLFATASNHETRIDTLELLTGSLWTGSSDGNYISRLSDVQISGNLDVSGIITAQEFHTEFVSSSIIYESGSTKFGDDCGDLHSFTGSVDISCSLVINGTNFGDFSSSIENRVTILENASASFAGDIFNLQFTQSQLVFTASDHETRIDILEAATGAAELWTASIDGHISRESNVEITGTVHTTDSSFFGNSADDIHFFSGKVGVGTASPTRNLVVYDSTPGGKFISVRSSTTEVAGILFGDTASDSQGQIQYHNSGDFMCFIADGDEQVRITGAGEVGIGTPSPDALLHVSGTTKFGNACSDRHRFTGSVEISCSLNVDGLINNIDITAFSSSVENRLTINEGDINNLQITASQLSFTQSQLVFTASDHETRIDILEAAGAATGGLWTGSNGAITRESDVQITGTLCVTEDVKIGDDLQITGSVSFTGVKKSIYKHADELNVPNEMDHADPEQLSIGASGLIKENVLAFKKSNDEQVYFRVSSPTDIDDTTNVEFILHWLPDPSWTSGNFVWCLEYLIKDETSNSQLGTPTTICEHVSASNATDYIATRFTSSIDLNSGQTLMARFYRDTSEDDGNEDGLVRYFEIEYTSDKLGE